MLIGKPIVQMRAAHAIEKATRDHSELLQPYKSRLIHEVAQVQVPKVWWHLAQLLSRLRLTKSEGADIVVLLESFLQVPSSILNTNAMHALADLTKQDNSLRPHVIPLLQHLIHTGTPAMRARGRMLLRKLCAGDR